MNIGFDSGDVVGALWAPKAVLRYIYFRRGERGGLEIRQFLCFLFIFSTKKVGWSPEMGFLLEYNVFVIFFYSVFLVYYVWFVSLLCNAGVSKIDLHWTILNNIVGEKSCINSVSFSMICNYSYVPIFTHQLGQEK